MPSGSSVCAVTVTLNKTATVPVKLDVGANLETVEVSAAAASIDTTTASGLKYQILKHGSGTVSPKATDTVKVNYRGTLIDGTEFDSSYKRNQPAEFPLNGVIKGWTEGVRLMVVGDKTRFWIPGELAYGNAPSRPGVPSGTLVFDIELLDILPSE